MHRIIAVVLLSLVAVAPEDVLWPRFVDSYTKPSREVRGQRAGRPRLYARSDQGSLRRDRREMPVRDAEASLAFLVDQGMVEVAGDTITVPGQLLEQRADSCRACISGPAFSFRCPGSPTPL